MSLPEHFHLPPPSFTPTTPPQASTGLLRSPSFNTSGGFPPLVRGGKKSAVPASSTGVVPSPHVSQLTPINSTLAMSGFTEVQAKEIFWLSYEVHTLCGKLAQDFIELSHQEVIFHMGAQATGHKKAARGLTDHSLGQSNEDARVSGIVAWLCTNSLLFQHCLEYQSNMMEFVNRSQKEIQTIHDHIWEVVSGIMGHSGRSTADGLEIALHLVDMLPSIPLQLTFNTVTTTLPRYTPKALASILPPDIE